jgi:hypothetical protein
MFHEGRISFTNMHSLAECLEVLDRINDYIAPWLFCPEVITLFFWLSQDLGFGVSERGSILFYSSRRPSLTSCCQGL